MKARLYTDGGARGNPGPAAYGYVLEAEDGTLLAAEGEAIGVATNNVAEYRGLLAGLTRAIELAVPEVEVRSDSELMVKQMKRRVPREERGAARALARGGAARAPARPRRVRPRHARARTSSPTGSSTRRSTPRNQEGATVCRWGSSTAG